MTKLSPTTRKLAYHFARDHFKECAEKFELDPGGTSWSNLEQAMWALQGATQLGDAALADIPLGRLTSELALRWRCDAKAPKKDVAPLGPPPKIIKKA